MIGVFSRYVGVQIAAYGIDMGGFVLLNLVIAPLPANVIAKIAACTFAFIAHRHITFKVHGHGDGRIQLLKYTLLLGLNVPISSGLLVLLLPLLSPAVVAKFVSDVMCVGLSFLASRYFVFTRIES